MTEPYFEAGKLALESLLLAGAFFYAHRSRRHARAARRDALESEKTAVLARQHAEHAKRYAERLESLLPPDVIPFSTAVASEPLAPEPAPSAESEPDVISFPFFKPRLAHAPHIPPHGGYLL